MLACSHPSSSKFFWGESRIETASSHLLKTRELPGNALVDILNWQIFTGNDNAFTYSKILT